jgi:hypothetical protein
MARLCNDYNKEILEINLKFVVKYWHGKIKENKINRRIKKIRILNQVDPEWKWSRGMKNSMTRLHQTKN